MAQCPDGLLPPTLRHVQRDLLSASDEQLTRIVGLLDGMERRGSADALIAPARVRLAQLRPARPLAFARLLFIPLDPLLVPAPQWSRGRLGLPRTAVLPLAAQVRAELGGLAAEVDAMIRHGRADDAALVLLAGTMLWPAAAAVLAQAPAPAGWTEATGLGSADHAAIARCAACVLSEAVWIHNTTRAFAEGLGPETEELGVWLEAATARRPTPPGALLAVLMARVPAAVALIGQAGTPPAPATGHAEPAIDFLLERLEMSPCPGPDSADPGVALQCAAALLDGLETPGPCLRPSRKPRTERLRRLLDERCQARFTENLDRQVLAPLPDAIAQGEMATLEEAARRLRRLEIAGRRLGGGDQYDRLLRAAAREIGAGESGSRVERARLIEILAGPEAALALLQS
jgi:hypothetical protein